MLLMKIQVKLQSYYAINERSCLTEVIVLEPNYMSSKYGTSD